MSNPTPGPWRAIPMGGSSTVVAATKPRRNDTRIPPYAYGEEHCVAYPFIDHSHRVRWDFVCFSHADARLISAAPDLLEALEGLLGYSTMHGQRFGQRIDAAKAAIAKAKGEP